MKENSLLGWNASTSVEIPYSSLTFKSNIKERPREVDTKVEVWAFRNSRIIGNGTRYTNVGMYGSYISFSIKKENIIFVLPGEKLCLYLTSIHYCRGCLRVYKSQLHLVLEVCRDFPVSALSGGR